MEIILIQDVDNLGSKNDIVNVRPGYANNFLIPQGYAVAATPSAKKVLAENIRQRAHKEEKLKNDALALAARLGELNLRIGAKASEGGKIYGSVTPMQIAEALEAQGFNVERKNITVEAIKEVGAYEAGVKLYRDVKASVKFEVVAE